MFQFRQSLVRNARLFSTSRVAQKSALDSAKEAAKTVDRTISDAAVKGIEKGGTLTCISTSPSSCLCPSPTPSVDDVESEIEVESQRPAALFTVALLAALSCQVVLALMPVPRDSSDMTYSAGQTCCSKPCCESC